MKMGDGEIELNFFDKLKRGVNAIQAQVRELKQQGDNGFSGPLSLEEQVSVKRFDTKIRSTYVETASLRSTVKCRPLNLDPIVEGLNAVEAELDNFIESSNLKKFGYKPWVNPHPIVELVEEAEPVSTVTSNGNLTEDEYDGTNGHIINHPIVEPQPQVYRQDASTRTPAPAKKSSTFTSKKKDFPQLGRTPQPYDFGITNNKRFTMLPKTLYKAAGPAKENEPTNLVPSNPFNVDSTTTYNIPAISGTNFNNITTPQNSHCDSSLFQEQETVEFTPGMTTRRPVAVRRTKKPQLELPKEPDLIQIKHISDKNLKQYEHIMPGTPTQPIPSKAAMESVRIVKSNKKSHTDTPEMPAPKIDLNLHQRLLAHKK